MLIGSTNMMRHLIHRDDSRAVRIGQAPCRSLTLTLDWREPEGSDCSIDVSPALKLRCEGEGLPANSPEKEQKRVGVLA